MAEPPVHDYPVLIPNRTDVTTPDGFRPVSIIDPFEAHFGPYFVRDDSDGGQSFAIPIDRRHLNAWGNVHGGLLMAFTDAALGMTTWRVSDWQPCVTLDLGLSFLKPAKEGDLVTVTPFVTRRTKQIIFVRGDLCVGGEAIATATSIWKIVRTT